MNQNIIRTLTNLPDKTTHGYNRGRPCSGMKRLLLPLVLVTLVANPPTAPSQPYPYQNPNLSSEERARDLLARLTLEEKVALLCDQSPAIPRLGIKEFNWWSEALHGLANNHGVSVFPMPIAMAASFNEELVYRIFDAVSDETRALYHDWIRKGNKNRRFLSLSVWTPHINIFRDPRWGRGQETFGEDPHLTARMGVQVVKGLQGPENSRYLKLLACAKHFAVHSGPDPKRHSMNVNHVDARDLYETYLPAFKALVQEAGVRQVMCAYQRLDDEPCCGNTRLLKRILREDWGFKHIVVSDCGAISDFFNHHKVSSTPVHAAAKAILAGTDVECSWDGIYFYKQLPAAFTNAFIREEDINQSVLRVLINRIDLGDLDDDSLVPWANIPISVVNCDKHKQLAYEMAQQSIVLLQNRGGILPLPKTIRRLAVLGPNANDEEVLWGSYNGVPVETITILEGIKSKLPDAAILYEQGCDIVDEGQILSYLDRTSFEGKRGIKITFWNNRNREGTPVATVWSEGPINLQPGNPALFPSTVNSNGCSALLETEFIPTETEEVAIQFGASGLMELYIDGEQLRQTTNWRMLPSRISYRFVAGKKYKIQIRFTQLYDWKPQLVFNFGKIVPTDYTPLIKKLEGIDIVIFVGGLSPKLEREEIAVEKPGFLGGDRTLIELPAVQRNFLKALKDAGKKIIFVICSGSAIALEPETQTCDAILQAWYGGQAAGLAVADVLFGDYNPSGKLPVTFYRKTEDLPDFENYSMKGRTYRFTTNYLFPFGFGLSYTTFVVGNASVPKSTFAPHESVTLTVPVSNTGTREGTTVIQIYVRKLDDPDGPIKTLRAFKRVSIPAGATTTVKFELPPTTFEFYDRARQKMVVQPGIYQLFYGTSSDPKDLREIKIAIGDERLDNKIAQP